MSVTDPIADALTLIRNASRAKKEKVDLKASKVIQEMLGIFKREEYIRNYRFIEDKRQGILRVYLKFSSDGKSAITELKRISKPGLRVYVKKDKIPYVLRGAGKALLSTPKGILTDGEAKKANVGGEIICYIW